MKVAPARHAAFTVLNRIDQRNGDSASLLASVEGELIAADRRLCHELVLGVLRRRMWIDRNIDALAPGRKIDREIRTVLRIAVYQLAFLDRVPPHAVVNDAVSQCRIARKTSAGSFVNAILRSFGRARPSLDFAGDSERIACELSHPEWLIERWSRQFGRDTAESIALANNQPVEPSYRWTRRTTESVKASLARECVPNRAEYLRELAANGKIYFQDPGSQMVARTVRLAEGESFLDVCAAPGGKTTLAALEASGRPALVVAGDSSAERVRVLADNCRRQGVEEAAIVRFDAVAGLPFADGTFDAVLVDAPCSGTGTIRSNPEIRYNVTEASIATHSSKQLAILENASKTVKRRGRLIYSTCSLETEENEEVARRFIESAGEFRVAATGFRLPYETDDGFARTFPHRDGTDGFFVAVFLKN
ncbi:MAG TPA: 16S rRNA (cytosine(967)-C(5))-methyltransferase RsmB [Pyrinomonadaceae bacterium]|nr:16S rRNA (cytosine(967)-C(5))-methyltransferase RsmB [Pyrinomonadaceae bacterium]